MLEKVIFFFNYSCVHSNCQTSDDRLRECRKLLLVYSISYFFLLVFTYNFEIVFVFDFIVNNT